MTYKLAVVATHPIQYQVPLWRAIARDGRFELKVYFASRHGQDVALDPGFGKAFAWDIPLLGGYDHEFLPSARIPILPGPIANLYPKGLADRFRMEKFDATLVLGYASGAAWAGMRAAWQTQTPVLMRGESHNHGQRPSLRSAVKGVALRPLLKRIDGFLAIGTWNKEYWQSFEVPKEKIRTALYSVDNEYFQARLEDDPEEPKRIRERWGAGPENVVFLFCGKLLPVKDPMTLFRAFAELPGERHHLAIVGAGPLEAELREFAQARELQRVHWEGFINQSRLPFYYRAADVLVLPSVVEPWGLVVNEALACGTPCIVSDRVGSGPDLVVSSGSGSSFPPGSTAALGHLMTAALNSPVRAKWSAAAPSASALANCTSLTEQLLLAIMALTHPAAACA